MKAWIARDTEGHCEIFCNRPKLVEDEYEENGENKSIKYWDDGECPVLEISFGEEFHPEVTFDNSPQCINLTDSDLLYILKKKNDEIIENSKREHQENNGMMFLPDLSLNMGMSYILEHIISLLREERSKI